MTYTLPKLPYTYDALEPYIDAKTMEIHYTKHHQTYIDKLNAAVEKHPKLAKKTAEELLADLNAIPEEIRKAVINHGGGHANHTFFWQILTGNKKDNEFKGKIEDAIKKQFESPDNFRQKFTDMALGRFGSGWCWLALHKGHLHIHSTANQDSPLSEGMIPILCLDVWEHAYYLKYMNKRADYVSAFWNIINWKKVNELYEKAFKK